MTGQVTSPYCSFFSPVWSETISLKFFSDLAFLSNPQKTMQCHLQSVWMGKGMGKSEGTGFAVIIPEWLPSQAPALKPWSFSRQLSSTSSWHLWPALLPAPAAQLPAGGCIQTLHIQGLWRLFPLGKMLGKHPQVQQCCFQGRFNFPELSH